MDKYRNDWTDSLAEQLEGCSEAAPEGLWDAVSSGYARMRSRRRAAWIGGSGIVAAALAVAVFVFRPVSPSGDSLPVGGGIVAQNVESASEAETAVTPDLVAQVTAEPAEPKVYSGTDEAASPAGTPETAEAQAPAEPEVLLPVQSVDHKEQNTRENASTGPENVPVGAPAAEPAGVAEPGTITNFTEPAAKPAKAPKAVPAYRTPKNRGLRVMGSISGSGYLAQDLTQTTTGYGIPSSPGIRAVSAKPTSKAASTDPGTKSASGSPATKASSGSGSALPNLSMLSRNRQSTTDTRHSQGPRYAFMLRLYLGERWSVESGVTLTTLRSEYNTESGASTSHSERNLTYAGIPLMVNYDILNSGRFSLYAGAGAAWESCISHKFETISYIGGSPSSIETSREPYHDHKWSVNLAAGAQIRIYDSIHIFAEPCLGWHIPDGSAIETLYTERPLSPSLTVGLRWSLQ